MFQIFLLHFSYLGVGLLLLRVIFKKVKYPFLLRLSLGYFVGILVHIIFIQFFITATLTSPYLSWCLLATGLFALIIEIHVAVKDRANKIKFVLGSPKKWLLNLFVIILLVPVTFLVTLKLVGLPDISYDPTCFWFLKSKYLFYGEHLWTDAFLDTHRVHPHPGYPLYMPIFIFEHYSILGVADDWLTKYGTWVYYTVGMILFFLLIRQWTDTTIALLAIIFMLYSPLYSYRFVPGTPTNTLLDFPLSLMIAASVGFFIRYLFDKSTIDLFSACVFVSSSLLLKREGTVWFILFISLAPIAIVYNQKQFWRNDYTWFLLPILTLICWKLISRNLPPESDLALPTAKQLFSLRNVFPKMIMAWLNSIVDFRVWGFLPIFIIPFFALGLIKNLRNLSISVPAFLIIGYLGAIFLILMLTEVQTGKFDYFMSVTYHRLILQLLPASMLIAIFLNSNKLKHLNP